MREGEILPETITALTQYVDKGDPRYRTEIYVQKKKKVVRGKRRFFKRPLCELVTAYLPTHFSNKHKMRAKRTIHGLGTCVRGSQRAKVYLENQAFQKDDISN